MKKIKALTMTMIFWILLIILSSAWLVLLIINNITFGKINIFLLLIFIVAGLSFSLSIYFIYQIIFDTRVELKKALEKEKSIEDIIKMDNS
jgi:hypothetical protein